MVSSGDYDASTSELQRSPYGRPRRRRGQFGPGRRRVFGALDLGTNNCRLLVASAQGREFRVIDAFSRIVRLGEGMSSDNSLREAAIDRTLEALKICAEKLARRRTTRMRSVATEACRAAVNRSEFVERVRREIGIALDIISPAEEARLAVYGCKALFDPAADHFLVFDIGGGSTELTFVKRLPEGRFGIVDWLSLPLGVVRLSEPAGEEDARNQAIEEATRAVREEFQNFKARSRLDEAIGSGRAQLIGSSGTVTTLASVALGLAEYDRRRVDGSSLRTSDMVELAGRIRHMSRDERAAMPCIGPDRADLLVPGCALLETLLETSPVDRLTVADRGIREGILRSLMTGGKGDEVILLSREKAGSDRPLAVAR